MPETGTLFCCHSSCAQYQIKDLQSSGGGLSLDLDDPSTPSRVQKKLKVNMLKNICITLYVVRT